LLAAYTKRYGVDPDIARDELMQLGFYDELCIQSYDKEGIDWEYRVEPLSGEMFVVPKGAQENEWHEIHQLF